MKKYIQLFIILLPLTVFGQSSFTVKGIVPSFTNGDKIYLFYRVNDVKFFDSTVVQNKSFAFKGTVNGIGIGYVCRNDNPMTAEILYDQQIIYIEQGDITVATADSLKNADVTGTALNRDNGELAKALKTLQNQFIEANNAYDALAPAKQAEVSAVANLRAKLKIINSKMEPIRFAFIKAHPKSYISLITLNRMINNADIFEVEKAFNDLTLSLKKSELGITVGNLITSVKQSRLGVAAIDFTLPNAAGKPVKLSAFKGKYVLVDFWASWCLPCRQENPNLKSAYEQYKANGFNILSVSIDDKASKNAWVAAIKKDGLIWTQVLDSGKKVKKMYGITTIPANVLVDPSGKIIARNIKDKVLQNTLAKLFHTN